MDLKKQKAFTLVELIVVITILAILGTISFISLQWYSATSRDSVRISDLSTLKIWLELFNLDAWKFPNPTSWFDVTYSWSVIWTQWTFWETTKINVNRLDVVPTDPLTNKEYTYSITKTKQEYQLWWIVEWWDLVNNFLLPQSLAWDKEATAIVTWNYNWQTIKTITWTTDCTILSVPSIISSESIDTTNLTDILESEWLVYNWYNNLPTNYRWWKYKTSSWFTYESNKLVVYSDTDDCNPLYHATDNSARRTLVTNLQTAYSWTLIENESNIKVIVSVELDNENEVNILWASLINNNIWWEVLSSEADILICDSWYTAKLWVCVLDICTWSIIANASSNASLESIDSSWQHSLTPWTCTFTCNNTYTWDWNECVLDDLFVTITWSTTNYNISNELWNPTEAINLTLTINAWVNIYSSSASVWSIRTWTLHTGSVILIVNNWAIYWAWWNWWSWWWSYGTVSSPTINSGWNGQNWWSAIQLDWLLANFSINNTGTIFWGWWGWGWGWGWGDAWNYWAPAGYVTVGWSGGGWWRWYNNANWWSAWSAFWSWYRYDWYSWYAWSSAIYWNQWSSRVYDANTKWWPWGSWGWWGEAWDSSSLALPWDWWLAGKAVELNWNSITWLAWNNSTLVKWPVD